MVTGNGICTGGIFVKNIFQNKAFRVIYKQQWDKFIAEGYPQLKVFMEEYAHLIEPYAVENGKLWPNDTSRLTRSSFEFRKNFEELKEWIDARVNYCNSHENYGIHN